jgi:hypothetical protein
MNFFEFEGNLECRGQPRAQSCFFSIEEVLLLRQAFEGNSHASIRKTATIACDCFLSHFLLGTLSKIAFSLSITDQM